MPLNSRGSMAGPTAIVDLAPTGHALELLRMPDRMLLWSRLLLRALAELKPSQRTIVVLRYWEDQSVETVADLLGVSTGTVKSQSARGLTRLRRLLRTGAFALHD